MLCLVRGHLVVVFSCVFVFFSVGSLFVGWLSCLYSIVCEDPVFGLLADCLLCSFVWWMVCVCVSVCRMSLILWVLVVGLLACLLARLLV